MREFLEHLASAAGDWIYVVLGGLAFGEAAFFLGMVLPGETALLVGGFLASRGIVSLPVMIVVAVVCAIVGDSVGYEVGRRLGPRIRVSRAGQKIGEQRWTKAQDFLNRHGGKAVLLGRWTAVLRALVPGMAGMSHMPYRTFLPWNALGGLIWGAGCVLLGYAFAESLDVVEEYLRVSGGAVIGLIIVAIIGHRIWTRRRARSEKVAALAGAGAGDDAA